MKQSFRNYNLTPFVVVFSALAICLYPILAPYKLFASFSMGLTILLVAAVLCTISSRKVFFNVPFLILFGVHSLLSLIAYFSLYNKTGTESIIWSIFMTFITCVAIMQIVPFFKKDIFIRVLISISIIAVVLLLYQVSAIMVGNIPYNGLLFGNLVNGYSWSNSVVYMRPNSFFSEPSYYAIYMLPVLVLLLNNKFYFLSLVIFISLILSTSTLGILGAFLILLVYSILHRKLFKFVMFLLVTFIILTVAVNIINLNWLFDFNLNKFLNLQDESEIRIVGYIEYFNLIPTFNQMIGVGFNQLSNFFFNYNLANYSNAFILTLINFGIIGFLAYIIYIIYSTLNVKKEGYIFIFILVLISCIDAFIYSPNFFYILYFILIFSKSGNKAFNFDLNKNLILNLKRS